MSEHPNLPLNKYGSEDDVACHYSGEQWDGEGMESSEGKKKKKKRRRSVIEMELFLNTQSDEAIKAATLCNHYYGEKNSEYIEWTILKDGEERTSCRPLHQMQLHTVTTLDGVIIQKT